MLKNQGSFFDMSPHSFLGARKNDSNDEEDEEDGLSNTHLLFGYNSVSVREEEGPLSPLRSLRECT